jgi:uncharacterized protein YecT (DUF1311 family)
MLGVALVTLVATMMVLGTTTTEPIVAEHPRATAIALTIALSQCQNSKNLNDYQMNMCLIEKVKIVRAALDSKLRTEAVALSATSPQDGARVVDAAQAAFETYRRRECLAEANPYTGGTIFPIVFGNCELSMYQQRLALVNHEISGSLGN